LARRPVRANSSKVLLEWYAFLEQMRTTALRQQMIEINGSLGGETDVVRIVEDIERLKGPGHLVAIAKRDLYQTSPLDVNIEVRPDVHGAPQH